MALRRRQLIGAALIVGAYAPLHRILDPARAGPAGLSTRQAAEAAWSLGLLGTLIVVGLAYVLSRLLPADGVGAAVASCARVLGRPGARAFATVAGLVAGTLSSLIAATLFDRLPTSVDAMAQLLHARAVSSGSLVLPLPGTEAAWTIQNGLVTPEGWASIYPPLHTLALAAGLAAGVAWLVGPVFIGVATWAAALSFERLLGPRVGRVGSAVLAVSPFWLLLGATHLSHTTAAAGLALVLWSGLRARAGGVTWAVASGAAVGVAVCARPWVGLVSSAAILGTLWWPAAGRAPELRVLASRAGAALTGGLPFAVLLFWWNARLFGHPLQLGYSAAFGPRHGLGFHVDPWGNVYGPLEALAYTGADLVQLGVHLLETPLPAVVLIGGALLLPGTSRAPRPLLAWALGALAANALYWHHGIHMGPRMLFESVPAWIALVVASATLLTTGGTSARVRPIATWAVVVTGLGAVLLVPGVVRTAAPAEAARVAMTPPRLPTDEAALVFVHGSWSSRIAARLVAAGMRRDSVETALRRNDICRVHRYARYRGAAGSGPPGGAPSLEFEPLPGSPPALETRELSPGNFIRVSPATEPDADCLREARADRFGTLELEPLAWQAPPLRDSRVALARDLGPGENAPVMAAMGRRSYVYVERGPDGAPSLLDYPEGMRLLWGE